MMTDRIVARAPATLTHRFSAAGAADVRVTVVDDAGSIIVEDVEATTTTDPDVFTLTVDASAVPAPTLLHVLWAAAGGWLETDQVEVAGGRYCLPAELRTTPAGTGVNRDRFDDAHLEAAIVATERRIEIATDVAWVPRYARRTVPTGRPARLHPHVREVLEVTVDGRDVDPSRLAVSELGVVHLDGLPGRTVDIVYLHGHDRPPADLRDAAVTAARSLAAGGASTRVPAMAESMSAGGFAFNFAHQADAKRGRPFGIPDVDAVVMSHALLLPAVG